MIPSEQIDLQREDLLQFFIHHLNKLHSAKTTLVSELPQLLNSAFFSDLREAIQDTIISVEKQIARMDEIYQLLPSKVKESNANGLKGLIEDSFSDIMSHAKNAELRDLSILFYLHNIESIEMASFQILEMVAVKLKNSKIKDLLARNYQEAKADRTFFLLISAKYISKA